MKNAMLAIAALVASTALAACTDDETTGSISLPGSDSTTQGEVAGQNLVVHEAVAVRVDGPEDHGVAIILTDHPGVCAALKGGAPLKSSHALTLFEADPPTGAAHIQPDPDASDAPPATFAAWGDTCKADPSAWIATDGVVEIGEANFAPGARTMGAFALAFGDDELSGDFAAVACDIVVTSRDPLAETPTCP